MMADVSELVNGMGRTSSPWRLGPLRVRIGALLAAALLGAAAACRSALSLAWRLDAAAEVFLGGPLVFPIHESK